MPAHKVGDIHPIDVIELLGTLMRLNEPRITAEDTYIISKRKNNAKKEDAFSFNYLLLIHLFLFSTRIIIFRGNIF